MVVVTYGGPRDHITLHGVRVSPSHALPHYRRSHHHSRNRGRGREGTRAVNPKTILGGSRCEAPAAELCFVNVFLNNMKVTDLSHSYHSDPSSFFSNHSRWLEIQGGSWHAQVFDASPRFPLANICTLF